MNEKLNFLIIKVNISTKVIKKGKKQRFSVILLSGNGEGLLGLGIGKAFTIDTAFEKAKLNSIRNLFRIPMNEAKSVFHSVKGKSKGTSVLILPKLFGKGLRAGPVVYSILKLVGINNACSKQIGNKNKLNVVYATIQALKKLESAEDFMYNKKLEMSDLLKRFYF